MPVIGVSVAVPEPYGAQLQDYRIALGDDEARQIPTHITLVPPYDVPQDQLDKVDAHLSQVAGRTPPFRVHLRGTGTFRPRSPVVFIGVVEGISTCERLAGELRTGPLAVESEFPYHPHVTVAHHLDDDALDRAFEELAAFECRFLAEGFHLYVHDDAVGWQPARHFPLLAAARVG